MPADPSYSSLVLGRSLLDKATLVEMLEVRSRVSPENLAFRYLVDGENQELTANYRELDLRARGIAGWLQERGLTGERAVLLFPPGLDFVAAFFGCLYAGVVAVPAYPPRMNRSLERIQGIVHDAAAVVALTTRQVLERVQPLVDEQPELRRMTWGMVDDMGLSTAATWRRPELNSETLAFLQYTSGSTGKPKGVMLTHGNLLHNLRGIYEAFQYRPACNAVFWLPCYHDMGLIGGILQPIYAGLPNVLLSPMAFLQRPIRWLRAISKYGASISGGPNFAYDLCVDKITPEERAELDLSSWKLAFTGAEPVRARTIDRFCEAFGPCGFSREAFFPCYGLAESTLFVSSAAKHELPRVSTFDGRRLEAGEVITAHETASDARQLVSAGHAAREVQVLIVDPVTQLARSDDALGEIWVKSASVARGYWNRPKETEVTFGATLADTGEGPFLRTGDLGFMRDGELYIAGRLKDMIIIRGVNLYPQDIEQVVERCHPAIRANSGAAFTVERGGAERLVVVYELERRQGEQARAALDAVRRAVARAFDVQVDAVLLVRPGGIHKTSSGKIQRFACRKAFLAGSLSVVEEWLGPAFLADARQAGITPYPSNGLLRNGSMSTGNRNGTKPTMNGERALLNGKGRGAHQLHVTGGPDYADDAPSSGHQGNGHAGGNGQSDNGCSGNGHASNGSVSNGAAANGAVPNGATPNGQASNGHVGNGHAGTGHTGNNGARNGQGAPVRNGHIAHPHFTPANNPSPDDSAAAGFGVSDAALADAVLAEVRNVAKERAGALSLETNILDLGLDSLERMEIVAALEERFGGRFPEEVLTQMETCQQVLEAVREHLGPPRGAESIPLEDYRFASFPEYCRLRENLDTLQSSGLGNPYFSQHQGITADTARIAGRELINFSNYNYLGMAGDPVVGQAAKDAIDRYGTSVSASRLVSGEKVLHRELEQALARFVGAEDAVVFVGGHSTNETTIGHLFGPGDLILHDSLAHNSIIQGCMLSGARRRPFAHNDWREADRILTELRGQYRRVLVAIEGVYSMDGDVPNLPRFIDVKRRHKAFLMIDEAHSIGTMGAHGRGVGEHFGIEPSHVDLWMGTLSKSFGSCGGYIAGCREVVEYLKYTAPGFVYSVGLSPPNAAAALASLRQLLSEPERVQRLQARSALFLHLAREAGLNTGLSHDSPVVPVILGNSMHCLQLSRALFARGINVQPILHPAVEEHAARLRFFITSCHTPEQIRFTVQIVAEELAKIDPAYLTHGASKVRATAG